MTTAIKVDDTELCDLERRARQAERSSRQGNRNIVSYLDQHTFIDVESHCGEVTYFLAHHWNPEDPRNWERNRWLSRDEALALLCPEEEQLEAKA